VKLQRDWSGPCIVAATGSSLTKELAAECGGHRVIAVNDAYRLLPDACMLYAADILWWIEHRGCPDFIGEKWTCLSAIDYKRYHHRPPARSKIEMAEVFGLKTIDGKREQGFSTDPSCIHFGSNSAFQAANIALLRGAAPVIFIALDMQGSHFFGEHPPAVRRNRIGFEQFIRRFRDAKLLQPDVPIINATPGSALSCFPIMTLQEALNGSGQAGSAHQD